MLDDTFLLCGVKVEEEVAADDDHDGVCGDAEVGGGYDV